MQNKKTIQVETIVHAPIEKVWKYWSEPEHIIKWNYASDDWHTPKAENDLRTGGKFSSIMASKDGKHSFDFYGTYDLVEKPNRIEYTLGDNRKVTILFSEEGESTGIKEIFEAENTNSAEMQKIGWQAILDHFKKYIETN